MKDLLCKAFCQALDVKSVPVGYAVRTPYVNSDGDPLLIYFVREGSSGRWRIEDDGSQAALLEAHGVDLSGRARGEAFHVLLEEHGAFFDKNERTVHSASLSEAELGYAGVQFVALLLRMQDLALLAPQIVRNTWREDALAQIVRTFEGRAEIEEAAPLSPEMVGQTADVVIRPRSPTHAPVAIYLGTSEERALHALVAKMEAEKYRGIDGQVALVVERLKKNPVKDTTFSLAHARLDAVLSFRETTSDSFDKLSRMAGINGASVRLQ